LVCWLGWVGQLGWCGVCDWFVVVRACSIWFSVIWGVEFLTSVTVCCLRVRTPVVRFVVGCVAWRGEVGLCARVSPRMLLVFFVGRAICVGVALWV